MIIWQKGEPRQEMRGERQDVKEKLGTPSNSKS